MRKKLRVWFMVLSAVGWVVLFAGLRVPANVGWVLWCFGIPMGLGFGIAAFALKSDARAQPS